uniref:Uncharacterized protein n=1 Tax=Rhizophora mucronata TaxID=61149 RepID=A0A2P2PF19_RHIMU
MQKAKRKIRANQCNELAYSRTTIFKFLSSKWCGWTQWLLPAKSSKPCIN